MRLPPGRRRAARRSGSGAPRLCTRTARVGRILNSGGNGMSSFSIDMDDSKEAWDALYREIEASAEPEDVAERLLGAPSGAPSVPADDLVGWLWLMHACWADDVS